MAKTVNVNFRMDSKLKNDMEKICDDIGINLTTAFTIFAKKLCKEKGIPFSLGENRFNEETLRAIEEVEYMEKHPKKFKSFKNAEAMAKDILK